MAANLFPGISFDHVGYAALKDQLSESGCVVHEPGSKGYAEASRLWNGAVERKPALVNQTRGPIATNGKNHTLISNEYLEALAMRR